MTESSFAVFTIVGLVITVASIAMPLLIFLFIARTLRGSAGGSARARARMTDPVPGTFTVTGASLPSRNAVYTAASLTGVISGDGVTPQAVELNCLIRTALWPRAGQVLPVTVDRANPNNIAIEWDKVQSGADRAMDQAKAIAEQMRRGATKETG